MKTIFEKTKPGMKNFHFPELPGDISSSGSLPAEWTREDLDLPELPEIEVIRHYIKLSRLNFGIETVSIPWVVVP